ncbi:hypothetical protein OHT52_30450 [Streptomyces sp. NBC_00247]|uniref:hypothetical protein n=1 Tax=Streptomyces sp. NBC_00247 TaxID=2975689 RepID=UPI002E2BECCD|nr:hypothetical protein [Streptomyces sp. NBC_00247]
MTVWGLIVEQNLGLGGRHRVWSPEVLGQLEGTRDEALAALRVRAEAFRPMHPGSPRRRVLYRHGDGFLLVLTGAWQDFHCRFSVAELLSDSGTV